MSAIKDIHVLSAVLSFSGFVLRGIWMMRESPMLMKTWVKIVPHIVDTVLLLSAIWLAINIQQYPGTHGWLSAKVIALILYIVLGSIGLKYGKTRRIRVAAWLTALIVFVYIVGVALTHNPIPVIL